MKKKINVTVIIPVHTAKDENFDKYIKNAVASIDANDVLPEKVMFVAPANTENILARISAVTGLDKEYKMEFIVNPGKTDFASQMNYAVSQVTTKYFSFLEFDDEYSKLWFKNADLYMQEYPDVSVFLPIISDTNVKGDYLGYTNETAWAYEFTDKHGYLDAEIMKEYPNFNPDGMIMKTEDFKRIGGYKHNIKLTFNLEFLLRVCDQSLQIMVIPKIGYRHINMRPDSLFWLYKNGDKKIDAKESVFWMETARKEFYYLDDREVTYVPDAEPITEPTEELK